MSPEQFRAILTRLGLTQVGAAKALEIDPRTVRRYCSGEYEVTRLVELALDGLAQTKPAETEEPKRP